jgi:hypothetical protein
MKLKALKDLLTNKFHSKYIPTQNISDHVIEEIINHQLEYLFTQTRIDE